MSEENSIVSAPCVCSFIQRGLEKSSMVVLRYQEYKLIDSKTKSGEMDQFT